MSYHNFRFKSLYQEEKNLVIRYEDIIDSTEEKLASIYKYLNVDPEIVSCEFNYFIKQGYIGKKIDPMRDLNSRKILDENQKKIIKFERNYLWIDIEIFVNTSKLLFCTIYNILITNYKIYFFLIQRVEPEIMVA